MKSKLFVLVLVIVLTALAATPIAASPFNPTPLRSGTLSAPLRDFLAAPCAPGAAYDPACDANQDGAVNVLDVQLTAGHWNQTGTWLSDNSHDHLGQTWTGSNNSLVISGPFDAAPYVAGQPIGAPLVLGNTLPTQANSYGYGLRILDGTIGAVIDHAGTGIWVQSTDANGLVVNSAGANGLYVDSAVNNGLVVNSAGYDGLYVGSAGHHGVYVGSSDHFGVFVGSAYDGVDAAGDTYAGYFVGDIYVIGNCLGCLQANFAVNAGDHALQPGDAVSILAVTRTDFDTGPALWQVTRAQPGQAVVGVAAGRAEVDIREEHRATETGKRLVPREGAAQPGDYVSIVYSGPMQVRATGPILAGAKLTIDDNGGARGLRKTEVNGVPVAEDAPVLGIALSELQDGMVWVLVNPQ